MRVASSRFLVVLVLLSSVPRVAMGAPPAESVAAASAALDRVFAPTAGRAMPGAAVVVLRDGHVIVSRAWGLENVEMGEANTTRTLFRLASVTKSFTALAVLRLAEQGRLSLDDPLEKYVPGFVGGDAIRLRHVLSHTAGLPDFMSLEDAMKLPPDGAPGERLNYSNIGYSALGRVIEKVTGKPYAQHLREAIFEPVGMRDTGLDAGGARQEGLAVGYLFKPDGGVVKADYTDSARSPASGGLHSTAEDMTRWITALLAGRIVRPETLENAMTPVALAGGRRGVYGQGFMLVPYRGLREVGHGGDISGFNTYVATYPEEGLSVIVLSNVGMRPPGPLPSAGDIAHAVVDAVAGPRLGSRWPPVARLAPGALRRYAGRYGLVAPAPIVEVMGDAIEIDVDGDRAVASGKQGRAEIFPESETEFFSKEGPVRIAFLLGPDGVPVEGVLSLLGLREYRLKRLP